MNDTFLLTDADVLAYRMSAAVEKRSVIVTHKASGRQKEFDKLTDFKKFLKEQGREFVKDSYDIVNVQSPEDLANCLHIIRSVIKKLETFAFADKHEMYLSADLTFREKLDLPSKYKGNRVEMVRPIHLNDAKQYLIHKHKAVKAATMEADDVLSIRAYEEIRKGNRSIIASNDKDTLQAEGVWFYNWTEKNPKLFEVPLIGSLEKEGPTVKGFGLKFFAFQLLAGDTTDNYKPYELSGKRFGAGSAYSLIDPIWEQDEILQAVVDQYKLWYPEPFDYTTWEGKEIKSATWENMIDLYFKCAYMKRSRNDLSDWKLFFETRGVNL
jgi:hypothetical protein